MTQSSKLSAADQAFNADLARLVGRAGDKPGKRVAAETPLRTKAAIWGAGAALAAAGIFAVARPGGSIDADNPVNGGLKPVSEHAVPEPEAPTATTIIKVQPGDTMSEIAENFQQSGLVDPNKDPLAVQESIHTANDDKYRDVLPAGADLVVPVDVTQPASDEQPR